MNQKVKRINKFITINIRIALFGITLLYGLMSEAQPYSCDVTKIGKLIVKPLLENGTVNYKKAVSNPKVKVATVIDFTSIIRTPEDGNTYVARHHELDSTTAVELLFVCEKSGECIYQITSISKTGISGFRLNDDGEVIEWDENEILTNEIRQSQQEIVDQLLSYFQ